MSSTWGNFSYTMGEVELASVEEEKDVGVIIHQTMKPSLQCGRASARAHQVLGQLTRGVVYRDKDTILRLYMVYMRPHLEYTVVTWSPWTKTARDYLEKIQMRAIVMVSNWQAWRYKSRLHEMGMKTLQARWERGNMITTFSIMEGFDRLGSNIWFRTVEEGRGVGGVSTRRGSSDEWVSGHGDD